MVTRQILSLALVLLTARSTFAQGPRVASDAWKPVGRPLILREHENEGVLLVGLAGIGATIIYDVVTAPRSARWYNDRHPERAAKSPEGALVISVVSTVVPTVVGAWSAATDSPAFGGTLIVGGLLVGPSAGHFYAGRPGRAVKTIVLRIAIPIVSAVASAP